jgi:hypothetical protein
MEYLIAAGGGALMTLTALWIGWRAERRAPSRSPAPRPAGRVVLTLAQSDAAAAREALARLDALLTESRSGPSPSRGA